MQKITVVEPHQFTVGSLISTLYAKPALFKFQNTSKNRSPLPLSHKNSLASLCYTIWEYQTYLLSGYQVGRCQRCYPLTQATGMSVIHFGLNQIHVSCCKSKPATLGEKKLFGKVGEPCLNVCVCVCVCVNREMRVRLQLAAEPVRQSGMLLQDKGGREALSRCAG